MARMEHADLTPGQRRMLPAQRARKRAKFARWADEMREHGWLVIPPHQAQTVHWSFASPANTTAAGNPGVAFTYQTGTG